MTCVLEALEKRGFIYQTTDDDADPARSRRRLRALLDRAPVTVYVGFDPSASSLHVGNLATIMALMHLQRAGHRPIAIVGGGTGLVGDPSGKQEMRQLLTQDLIVENLQAIRGQLERYLDLSGGRALLLNNADWLRLLNYLEFLRDIGRHFSVNRMLTHDCFKIRLESETGLSFLEFNYMLLQAYDFLVLFQKYGCRLQLGGSDQWGNIVAGTELIRRVEGGEAYGATIPLIQTASGKKMGKTEEGAVWLDSKRFSPYAYYQFWINTEDADVGRFLRIFTFLDLKEIEELERLHGADIRRAKEVLAFEATRLTHGEIEAAQARSAAQALFTGGAKGPGESLEGVEMPTLIAAGEKLAAGIPAVQLCVDGKLCASRNEARRLAQQGGLYLNGEPIAADRVVTGADLKEGGMLLRAGKKRYLRVKASP
ncbi:MAG: tyrosine--tRNA ligase [Planctomycetes bacterium]|nr:tyrosine--tRNA ligase [Planctomycetota bacterium]